MHFLPHLDDAGLIKAYSAAALVVVPSLYEGFGLPALEAMACGAPVIVSDRASLPEVVGEAGLVSPPDAKSLAQAMGRVLHDEALRGKMRLAGPERAARFSWRQVATDTLETYEQVMAQRRST